MSSGFKKAPLRDVDLGPLAIEAEHRSDGTILARSPFPLRAYAESVTARLDQWAEVAPQRSFLAERDETGGWRHLSYAEARACARAIGKALLARGLNAERPLVILSGNSIAHAQLALAALYVGIPYAPVSPAYSLATQDFSRLNRLIALLTPGLVFAEGGDAFAPAIRACGAEATEVVSDLSSLSTTTPGPCIDAAHAKITGDTIAKILFTSGSTSAPKAVVTTHRMLSSNQAMIAAVLRFLRDEPPIMVDWLPWHHSFGGNHNFGIALQHGGTFYIDKGRPTDEGMARTIETLREISPTIFFNVPQAYERLIPYLAQERALAENFFRSLKLAFFAGAILDERTRTAFDDIAVAICGRRIRVISGFGATETAPSVLFRTGDAPDDPTLPNVGLPLPGQELKLAPLGDRFEARVKGPNVMRAYWRNEELSRASFDDEGFYRLGDALRFADVRKPHMGFLFDGRLDEDFKLASGATVHAEMLRARALAQAAPFMREIVVAGENRQTLVALIFPDFCACRTLIGEGGTASNPQAILAHPAVLRKFRDMLAQLSAAAAGASERITRAALLAEPPSAEAGEITDKGTLNRRALLTNRAAVVEALHAGVNAPFFIDAQPQSTCSPWAGKAVAGSAAAC
jgi:feruloyl-CoA synthase